MPRFPQYQLWWRGVPALPRPAAPCATSSGMKWSGYGWACTAAGASDRYAARLSVSPLMRTRVSQSLKATAQSPVGAPGPSATVGSPSGWTAPPLPRMRTPSSFRGAIASPSARCRSGSRCPWIRELDDRHAGVRVHQHEGHPGTVVEPPARVPVAGDAGRFNKIRSPGSQLLRSGGGIRYPVQLCGEPREVVEGLRVFREGDRRSGSVPVRGNAEDGPDAGVPPPKRSEEFPGRLSPFEGQGRRTVRDKNRWEGYRGHAGELDVREYRMRGGGNGGDHYPRSGPSHGRRSFSLSFLKNAKVTCSSAFSISRDTAGSSSGPARTGHLLCRRI